MRLALRRDRIKLPVIILVLAVLFASSVAATIDYYGKDQASLMQYAATMAPSVVARVFNGPIGGADIGAVVLNETFMLMMVPAAFISTMAVVRHTRQNEEFGRSELIESGAVARHASLAAAMLLALLINMVLAGIMFISLVMNDLPADGSLFASLSVLSVGMVFAAVAAVAAQLADSARGANAYSALAIGGVFLLRGIGDGGGRLGADGMSVISAWPAWLSPFGWAQQIFPYTQQRTGVLWLFLAAFICLTALAVVFMARRDIGMGMISTRPGRVSAKPSLLSSFGLARRLQRGILRGWSIAIVVFSIAFGLTIKEFESFLADNEEVREAFAQMGVSGSSYRDIFLAVLISMMVIMITGYAVQALLRARSEETGGQLENVLSGSVSRHRWLLGHVVYIISGVVLLLVLMSLSMGASYVVSVGADYSEIWRIIGASLAPIPGVLAFLGFVALIFAVWPRIAVPAAWAGFAAVILIVQLSEILRLPQWVKNVSPFTHLPAMPARPFSLAPVVWLTIIGLALLAAAFVSFRKRDLSTE